MMAPGEELVDLETKKKELEFTAVRPEPQERLQQRNHS